MMEPASDGLPMCVRCGYTLLESGDGLFAVTAPDNWPNGTNDHLSETGQAPGDKVWACRSCRDMLEERLEVDV